MYYLSSRCVTYIKLLLRRSIDGAMTCVEGCMYCGKCLPGTVCPNKNHIMGALKWKWEELKDRADYNHDKVDYMEKYTLMKASTAKACAFCGKMAKSGFICSCNYCVCTEAARYIYRNPKMCINKHEMTIMFSSNLKSCVMCDALTNQIWNCKCEFNLCTKCEPISHNTRMCPNGHFLERSKSNKINKCFRCLGSRINTFVCPSGYSLCDNCVNEIDYGIPFNKDATVEEIDKKCQKCDERKAIITLAPCRHVNVCYECSSSFIHCPLCKVKLSAKEKIIT